MTITNDGLQAIRQILEQTMDKKLHPSHENFTICSCKMKQILEQAADNDLRQGLVPHVISFVPTAIRRPFELVALG